MSNTPVGVKTKPTKAIVAFALTFATLLLQALEPAAEHHPVTPVEWLIVILGAAVTAGTVFQVTNAPVNTNRRAGGI